MIRQYNLYLKLYIKFCKKEWKIFKNPSLCIIKKINKRINKKNEKNYKKIIKKL